MSRNIFNTASLYRRCLNTGIGVPLRFLASQSDIFAPKQINQLQEQPQQVISPDVKHHAQLADDWWNKDGPLRALHALNEIRVPFIRDGLVSRGNVDQKLINTARVLQQQRIIEVGCGGGILTEQLARLGACVTGIDLGEEVIKAAREHLEQESSELKPFIAYKVEPIYYHATEFPEYYDAVVLSEVLEHVDDKAALLTASVQALKPGGSIFITTINKTLPMWLGGVLIGEYVLSLAPRGTHHWNRMVSPLDLQRILDALNCPTVLLNGTIYDFWRNTWRWVNSTTMCYAIQAVKAESN